MLPDCVCNFQKCGSVPVSECRLVARMMQIMRFRPCNELTGRDALDVLQAWPASTPIAALHSQQRPHTAARWSILATPTGRIRAQADHITTFGDVPVDAGRGALDTLHAIDQHRRLMTPDSQAPPFAGWLLSLSYELGELLEPAVVSTREHQRPAGVVVDACWCPDALVHDRMTGQWWQCGHPTIPGRHKTTGPPLSTIGELTSVPPADSWSTQVAQAIKAIHRGDIFQVNLTRQLCAAVQGDPRTLAIAALQEPQAVFGCLLEPPPGAPEAGTIVSLSPELFFSIDAGGRITTRPIKGTLPADEPWQTLRDSQKDEAELHMIVDLMRNDLGRVCQTGTIEVTCPRMIESHPTVHHGVAEVQGQIRPDATLVDLLRATFPAGSITGAPKIRAMQIIRAFEPAPRGMYCGAIGMLGPGHVTTLSVAIRTAHLCESSVCNGWSGTLHYGVGCGIVADSDPHQELIESQDKARVLVRTLSASVSQSCDQPIDAVACSQSHA